MSTTTTDLNIPEAAETALALGNPREAIRLTVVSELRRLAGTARERADKWTERAELGTDVGPWSGEYMTTIADKYDHMFERLTTEANYLDGSTR